LGGVPPPPRRRGKILQGFFGKLRRKKGQGLGEYGLILVLIAMVVLVALSSLGTGVNSVFTKVAGSL
jgi:pilus assembly protein Flp/PilA